MPLTETMTPKERVMNALAGLPVDRTPVANPTNVATVELMDMVDAPFPDACRDPALAARLDGRDSRVHVLLGDGECDEGQIWEAAMSASHYNLDNLVAIVDRNGIQNDRFTSEVMELEPLADKWRSFRWHTIEIDGHSFPQVLSALDEAKTVKGKPTAIIAATVKGKGVSFMENNPDFHGKAPNKEQLEQALKELAD